MDLSETSLKKASLRIDAQGIDTVYFHRADCTRLPYADHHFDHVFVCFMLEHLAQPGDVLAELRRVLQPGGRAAFLVCGPREANAVIDVVNRVVTELFEFRDSDRDIDPFRFSAQGSLAQEMRRAGYLDVVEGDVTLHQRAPVGTRFWQASLERGLSLTLEQLPDGIRNEIAERMTEAFEPWRQGEYYELPSLSRITSGRSPE